MDDTEPTVNSVKESEQSVENDDVKELATDKQLESSEPKCDEVDSECVKENDIGRGDHNHIEEKHQNKQPEVESLGDDEESKPSIDSDVKSDDIADNKNTEKDDKVQDVDIKDEYTEGTNDDNGTLTEDSQSEAKDYNPDQSEIKDEDSQTSKTNDDQSEASTDKETTSKSIPDDPKDDDIENPQFENAPNLPDEPQDDHTQAMDPFDALIKDFNVTSEPSTSSTQANLDGDDHNADACHGDSIDLDADEPSLDDGAVTDPGEEPGAYEEVCLLPDTERELSEADKAEAEKALALKRQQAAEEAVFDIEETIDGDANKDDQVDLTQENGADKNVNSEIIDVDSDSEQKIEIKESQPTFSRCGSCFKELLCRYSCNKINKTIYFCTDACIKVFLIVNGSKYKMQPTKSKRYIIEEIEPKPIKCSECEEMKTCYFFYKYDDENTVYCSLKCLESMMADEKDKYKFLRRKIFADEIEPQEAACTSCNEKSLCIYKFERYGEDHYVCSLPCIKTLNNEENRYHIRSKKITEVPLLKLKVITNATDKYLDDKIQEKTPTAAQSTREDRDRSFKRFCTQCNKDVVLGEKNLIWETMDFCDEICLASFQNKIGAKCAKCKSAVQHSSLGKYCVRFGYDIRQFCNSSCLDEFKKGLKICCFCQKDISAGQEGFLAPVGDKRQFKDFCSQKCMEKFDQINMNSLTQPALKAICAVCSLEKPTTINVEIGDGNSHRLCSEPCFAAFKFVNNLIPDQCKWCKKYFERKSTNTYTIYDGEKPFCFCTKSCLNIYISTSRHIVPCNWCKVKKYNYDMIRKDSKSGAVMMCSLNCFNLYQVSVNVFSTRRIKCDMCSRMTLAQYHLTMSDATLRNFCSYQCVMKFQSQYSVNATVVQGKDASMPKPTGAPRRTIGNSFNNASKQPTKAANQRKSSLPVISCVQSLASSPPPLLQTRNKSKRNQDLEPPKPPKPITPPPKPPTPPPPPPKIFNHVLVKTIPPVQACNKATLTKPMVVSRGVSCRPHPCTKECQTDPSLERRVLIPIPVPIYVPVPCAMYSLPFPVPIPIPIPIPTPVFIPTTRNSAKGIMKEINKIHDKMPTDPFEAELLMMAEMVAGDKKKDQSDSETDEENAPEDGFSPVAMDGNNAFGEDMLQMALKMATEYEEPAVDLESAMTANTITPSSHPGMPGMEGESMHHHHMMVLEQQRAVAALRASAAPRKRAPHSPAPAPRPARGKRRRTDPAPPPPEPVREPAEKPDANMCLKYTFGVNAWKQWVMTKNAEIEKSSIRRKPFKSEILQLTADELNYSLCLFVKEVRKPNGSEYAPDTIYYLVLGIQQYLFENSRIDNIFTDPYYEKFTDCLDEVAKKFSILYNDSQYIVTRVEEEHLWESKQLGAHSPHVLLSTLMFFNTKHFNLVTVEEHMQLSFSHIMKHWKRNPNQPGQAKLPGSRNVLLRFYPPQSALEANSRKKKVYEQQENEENPLRCPVKLYEFYISKCPESVRTRNDVFYLQPERSCVPDSPVWYSTQPLSREALSKMLHRVKMVKEINIALLTS